MLYKTILDKIVSLENKETIPGIHIYTLKPYYLINKETGERIEVNESSPQWVLEKFYGLISTPCC